MVTSHVSLNGSSMHVFVCSNQVENVGLVVPSSPGSLESDRSLDPDLHHPGEQVPGKKTPAHALNGNSCFFFHHNMELSLKFD